MFNLVILSSLVVIFLDESGEAAGNEIYVDDNWYPFRDGTAEHPYSSIQYAIDIANEGDTIYVFGGDYNESLLIAKRITLIGSVDEGNTSLFNKIRHMYTVEITADFVTFEGFNVSDEADFNMVSLIFVRSDNVVIHRNNLTQSDTWAIYLDFSSEDNTIGNNMINDTKGIYLSSSANNVLSNNNITNTSNDAAVTLYKSNNNILYKNNLSTSKYGIYAVDCSNCNFSNNELWYNSYDAIRLHQGSNNVVLNNIARNNGGNGIDLSSSYAFVKNNTLYNNQIGIKLTQSNCNITNNSIYYSRIHGIYAEYGSRDNLMYFNDFFNNYQSAIDKGSNDWDNGVYGNSWSDYNEVDRDLDGIGDTPYKNSGVVDMYPLGYFLKPPKKAENPDPEDGKDGLTLKVTLVVDVADLDSEELDVYFYDAVTDKLYGADYNVKNDIEKVRSGQPGGNATCSFTLNFSRTFFWYAIVNDSKLENRSDIWYFVTKNRPPENEKPVADPGGPYAALIDQVVSFDASGSTDPDGEIDFYRWNFGDGTSEILAEYPKHEYSEPGTYQVTLTVIDNDGTSAIGTTMVVVTEFPTSFEPVADLGGPYYGEVRKSVSFNGSDSYDLDGTIVNYTWTFGDGTKGYGVNTNHVYVAAGEYAVTLTVTDNESLVGSESTTAIISLPKGSPGFEFIFIIIALAFIVLLRRRRK